ncbi:MAG: pantetheine-phosphate adenylyltransferase [Candidatus Methanomethylicia archaeon]
MEEVVAVGGTFDNLHLGHVQLLLKCFEISEHVIIGITSDKFVKSKNHFIDPLEKRENGLLSFLKFFGVNKHVNVIVLNDHYGPTIHDENISSIVVSEETLKRAVEINKIRAGKGLKPLKIFFIPLSKDIDLRPISSTKLRRKERFCEKFLF